MVSCTPRIWGSWSRQERAEWALHALSHSKDTAGPICHLPQLAGSCNSRPKGQYQGVRGGSDTPAKVSFLDKHGRASDRSPTLKGSASFLALLLKLTSQRTSSGREAGPELGQSVPLRTAPGPRDRAATAPRQVPQASPPSAAPPTGSMAVMSFRRLPRPPSSPRLSPASSWG